MFFHINFVFRFFFIFSTGRKQDRLAVTGGHWRSLAVTGGYWPSLAVTGGHWRSLAVTPWRLLAVTGGHWPSLAVTGRRSILPTYNCITYSMLFKLYVVYFCKWRQNKFVESSQNIPFVHSHTMTDIRWSKILPLPASGGSDGCIGGLIYPLAVCNVCVSAFLIQCTYTHGFVFTACRHVFTFFLNLLMLAIYICVYYIEECEQIYSELFYNLHSTG